jgi:MinD-like ATPase involved in chromosome partitioning or flagellar assembly
MRRTFMRQSSLSSGSPSHVFIVLLREEEDAAYARTALEDLNGDGESALVLVPTVRGVDFFADAAHQDELDAWWRYHVPPRALPVYLLEHEPGLLDWIPGLDGIFYVAGAPAGKVGAPANGEVRSLPTRSVPDLVSKVTHDLGVLRGDEAPATPDGGNHGRAKAPASPNPFDLLVAMSTSAVPPGAELIPVIPAAAGTEAETPSVPRGLLRLPGWARRAARRERAGNDDAELATLLCNRRPTIVAVGSRKGGVGKTSHAAGIAIVAGGVLDTVGHRAAIVDANIANPDAWGQLSLPPGAATVRDVIAKLAANQEPPRPVHASTPALACYPETRQQSEYSRLDIARFADFLRAQYTLIVVDMSNRLPDPTAGPEAAAAAYWLEQADVLVLPTASSKQDFNGVLDYLEIDELPSTIVAYLVPRTRRNREHPLTKRYMSVIEQRACQVINLPDDAEGVRYAGMEGIPVQDVSPAMRAAYRDLTAAIANAPPRPA